MRILHIHNGDKGGAERFFVYLLNGLSERGVKQMAVIQPKRIWRPDIESACRVEEVAFARSFLGRIVSRWQVKKLCSSFQPEFIMLWKGAGRLIPESLPSGTVTVTRLGDYPKDVSRLDRSDFLIANTADIARSCTDRGWPAARMHVIGNFSTAERASAVDRSALDTPDGAFLIVAMGRFVDKKGFATLIEALASVEGAYLWLLGDGPMRTELEEMARERNVGQRLRMPGWLNSPEPYVAAADVFCCPSSHEPFGNVVLDGWSQDVPVVSTRSQGPSMLIEHEKNGLLTPIGDAEQLAAALTRVKTEPELSDTLRQGAAETVRLKYSKDVIVDAYMDFFKAHKKSERPQS